MNALSYILEMIAYVVLGCIGVAGGFLIIRLILREIKVNKKMDALFEDFEQKKDKE